MLGRVGWLRIARGGIGRRGGSRRFSGKETKDTAAERLGVFPHMGTGALGSSSYEKCHGEGIIRA